MTRMPETPGIKMSGLSMTSWYPLYPHAGGIANPIPDRPQPVKQADPHCSVVFSKIDATVNHILAAQ